VNLLTSHLFSFFAKIASVLCDHHPHYSNHLAPNGTIVVKLDKALYGCIESAKLWYNDLSSCLLEIGFKKSESDECTVSPQHYRRSPYSDVHIAVFVDDFKITCREDTIIKSIEDRLKAKYKDLRSTYGKTHTYLGMEDAFVTFAL
jgi:hypothetical protein